MQKIKHQLWTALTKRSAPRCCSTLSASALDTRSGLTSERAVSNGVSFLQGHCPAKDRLFPSLLGAEEEEVAAELRLHCCPGEHSVLQLFKLTPQALQDQTPRNLIRFRLNKTLSKWLQLKIQKIKHTLRHSDKSRPIKINHRMNLFM